MLGAHWRPQPANPVGPTTVRPTSLMVVGLDLANAYQYDQFFMISSTQLWNTTISSTTSGELSPTTLKGSSYGSSLAILQPCGKIWRRESTDGTISPIMLITEMNLLITAAERESKGSTLDRETGRWWVEEDWRFRIAWKIQVLALSAWFATKTYVATDDLRSAYDISWRNQEAD